MLKRTGFQRSGWGLGSVYWPRYQRRAKCQECKSPMTVLDLLIMHLMMKESEQKQTNKGYRGKRCCHPHFSGPSALRPKQDGPPCRRALHTFPSRRRGYWLTLCRGLWTPRPASLPLLTPNTNRRPNYLINKLTRVWRLWSFKIYV